MGTDQLSSDEALVALQNRLEELKREELHWLDLMQQATLEVEHYRGLLRVAHASRKKIQEAMNILTPPEEKDESIAAPELFS